MVRLAITFVMGIMVGASIMVLVDLRNSAPPTENPEESSNAVAKQTESQNTNGETLHPVNTASTNPPTSNPVQPSILDSEPKLPETYRQFIGPPVSRLTFAERLVLFEGEARDESWALSMELGINNYIAAHGAEAGAVFKFVQCRSNWCVLAGYILPGYPDQSSEFISPMRKEAWWQGGNFTSSHGGIIGENEAFVIMLSRFTRQR